MKKEDKIPNQSHFTVPLATGDSEGSFLSFQFQFFQFLVWFFSFCPFFVPIYIDSCWTSCNCWVTISPDLKLGDLQFKQFSVRFTRVSMYGIQRNNEQCRNYFFTFILLWVHRPDKDWGIRLVHKKLIKNCIKPNPLEDFY